MKLILAILASLTLLGNAYATDPALPEIIGTEAAIEAWVVKTIHDSPPVGGEVRMLKHMPPHYAKNDRVGEIWIIPAIVQVTVDGKTDFEEAFSVYHVDTKVSELAVDMQIPENQLQKFLDAKPEPSATPAGAVAI